MQRWRLVDTGPLDGPKNMAVDEALLKCFEAHPELPVLRLYGWEPAALSLGRFQDAGVALNLDLCVADGVPVVRRMTGGGIIYHGNELTYSIVCSPDHLDEVAGVKAGFRKLCSFLLGTYRRLGLDPAFATDLNPGGERLGGRTDFCFAGKEEFDVVVNGRKIGGNAQRRLRGAILQHGSIPLRSMVQQAVHYLREPAPEAAGAVSLAELGLHPELPELKAIVAEAFQEGLGVRLVPGTLNAEEQSTAAQLEETKYSCSEWNTPSPQNTPSAPCPPPLRRGDRGDLPVTQLLTRRHLDVANHKGE